MSFISVNNFVSVSVATPPTGLRSYAVNNLAIFTKETPVDGTVTAANPGVYVSPADVLSDWGASSEVYAQAVAVFAQSPNILDGGGSLVIFPMQSGDVLTDAISAGIKVVFFGGALWAGYTPNDAEVLAAAATVETLQGVKLIASSYLTSSLTTSTGLFWHVKDSGLKHTRCVLYTVAYGAAANGTTYAAGVVSARLMAASYAGRAFSTDFTAPASTSTIHGKTLVGVASDTGITQTILNTCNGTTVGVDTYPSVGGGAQYLGKVFCTGGNDYFDNVYNLDWLVSALQVAGFNALTTVGTKIPQTETGMIQLKSAYIGVLQQSVANNFVAPGVWNSPELFGSPADLRRSVLNTGFYIYSQPVNRQAQAQREQRKAPLVQIAIKFAGAVQSSSVVVNFNP
ncbi:MAG: DUF3383 family protein [Chloroflexota bacterium]|nr:DUF3383 family protein [Chloroflexota bacterium]